MGNENKLLKGLFVGAAVGTAIALLDKQTRKETLEKGKQAADCMKQYIDHPSLVTDILKEKMSEVKDTIKEVSDDLTFMKDKVNELKELTPQVIDIIEETREKLRNRMDEKELHD
ncbi:YtxH domain-containing protein [Bacillus sp. FJAT-47783]|uniref:YtxH domain-containing protein n=1 Tax=Bacillus sp. FJAT-47783 TaxID=2922712 RepID=UPI001FABB23A|nr:YtxH domain-containing protein [Bacillus sp. FJAT-47783]